MHPIEKLCINLRHSPGLNRAEQLWSLVRPAYDRVVGFLGRNGIERNINGTDRVLLSPRFRGILETYEAEVWKSLMGQIKSGDIAADVGAFVGLYSIALANRVGPFGKVFAFEPDAENFASLKAHVELNGVSDRVELFQMAVGSRFEVVPFQAGRRSGSHIKSSFGEGMERVQCVKLDGVFANRHLDILKVDVEGYEEKVLLGSVELLQDRSRCPRAIYIEVHPYVWPEIGTTSESLLNLLERCHYRVFDLNGREIKRVDSYGEIVALADKALV